MKRDFGLIRRILLALEEEPPDARPMDWVPKVDASRAEIREHLLLMVDQKWILLKWSVGNPRNWNLDFIRMTSRGHAYLDSVREESE